MEKHTKIWRVPKPNQALQEIFSLRLGVSKVVAQILVNRGITTLYEAKMFLYGETSNLYDPFLMKDMDKAVERIKRAVSGGERIRIFGDYDVDGITSTAILAKVLLKMGANIDYYIPERLTEGYGMNKDAVTVAGNDGISLVITVDSGISSIEEIILADGLNIDVVITDHHEPGPVLPQALAVINPKRPDCPYPFKNLAGAGVAYKLALALSPEMDSDMAQELVELVCLGTIADIVPLKEENRILVKQGLASLGGTKIAGLLALMDLSGINTGEINARQVAFQLAPKINAAGRVGDATGAVKMLLSEDNEEATALAAELCALNEERQGIEAGIYREARNIIDAGGINLEQEKVIVLAREGWHLGVIGIVAAKLVQDYYRPVILLSIEGDIAKGSARSIPAFNLFEALQNNGEYLLKYGGHKQAAGLTIFRDTIATFSKQLNAYADKVLGDEDLLPEVFIDGEVDLRDLSADIFRQMQMLAPYGCDNPVPVMACRKTGVMEYRKVGSDGSHLKMKVRDSHCIFDAIGFNMGGQHAVLAGGDLYDMAFTLEKNEWNGRTTLQLNIKDFKPAGVPDLFEEGNEGFGGFVEDLFRHAVEYLTDDYYRDIADKEEFYTKVVGVTFDNRQDVVAGLQEGEALKLVRETNNPYDTNAVRVEDGSGRQAGYLNARLAKHFAPLLDHGEQYLASVSQVTGGREKNYGVNIVIRKIDQEDREAQKQKLSAIRAELSRLPDDELMEKIRLALLGGNPYREKQEEALGYLFQGRRTLAIFGTGRGKSAVFQSYAAFTAIRSHEMTVIVYPLRALVNDQFENMSARLAPLGLRVFKGNGSISGAERAELFEAIGTGEVDILLTTPEFIAHHLKKFQAAIRKTGFFVVDESHHIGMASQAHRPLYKRLGQLAASLGEPVVLAVTATANDEVARQIIDTLGIESVVIDPHVRINLQLVDKRDWSDKSGYLKTVVSTGDKTIIYVNSRLQTVELAAMLREALPHLADRIIFYHAGLTSEQRNTIERMFRSGEVTAVVSTSAFGEGIDIPDVKHIVVFHLNFNFTEFNQQCGRCGRNGQDAQIHLLCGKRDAAINRFILDASSPDRDTMVRLYMVLKEQDKRSQPITLSNEDLAKALKSKGIRYARPNLVSAGLGILEELELIQRETFGRERQISLLPVPEDKIDIENSLRFTEGQEEKRAFNDFETYFFQASPEELLSFINSPIYPEKYLRAALPYTWPSA